MVRRHPDGQRHQLGRYDWSGGTLFLTDTTLTNNGTIEQTGGQVQFRNATLNNAATGVYNLESDGDSLYNINNPSAFNNAGLFEKTGGGGGSQLSGLPLNNTGVVQGSSGTFNFSGGVVQISGTTLTGGTWNVTNGATINLYTAITTNSATVLLSGAGSQISNFGGVTVNNGSLTAANGAVLSLASDLANNGRLALGAGGTVNISGNLTEGPASTLEFDVGGAPVSGPGPGIRRGRPGQVRRHLDGRARERLRPASGEDSYTVATSARIPAVSLHPDGARAALH